MILVSRSEGKLQAVAKEIGVRGWGGGHQCVKRGLLFLYLGCICNPVMSVSESIYGRQTRIIQTDFTAGPQIYPGIAEKLQGLEIGILGTAGTQGNGGHPGAAATNEIVTI